MNYLRASFILASCALVPEVNILKSSGDPTFDRVAVKTLLEWRLRKGPLNIQLPRAFKLTPDNYRIWIP